MAFVAIGATMVGSITFTKKKGDYVKKGDEVCQITVVTVFRFLYVVFVYKWHLCA